MPLETQLAGTETSLNHEYISLHVDFDPNRPCGKTYEQYMEEIKDINLVIYSSNEVLDPLNFDDPIKTILDDKYSFVIDPRVKSFNRMYIRK